jgi:WD40 repeat protein
LSFSAVKKLVNFLYTNDLPIRSAKEIKELSEAAGFLEISLPPLVVSESNRLECSNTLIGHSGYVCTLLMTQDGLIVSGSRDNSIRVWDPKSSRPRVELSDVHSNRVWALASVIDPVTKEEKVLSGSWDSTVIVWNPKTWRMEKRLTGHDDWVTCLSVVGKKHVVSGSSDSTLRIWNTSNFEPERTLRGHRGHIYAVCPSSNSEYLFSAGSDGFIYVWETKHWRVVSKLKGHTECIVRGLAWCSALESLVSGASDGRLKTWSATSEAERFECTSDTEAHTDWVEAMCEMSKGRFASGARDCTVKIWNTDGWGCLQTIRQHSHWVYALIYERDILVSASCDMKIKIWEEEKEVEMEIK